REQEARLHLAAVGRETRDLDVGAGAGNELAEFHSGRDSTTGVKAGLRSSFASAAGASTGGTSRSGPARAMRCPAIAAAVTEAVRTSPLLGWASSSTIKTTN